MRINGKSAALFSANSSDSTSLYPDHRAGSEFRFLFAGVALRTVYRRIGESC
jgi:hypothetical protein